MNRTVLIPILLSTFLLVGCEPDVPDLETKELTRIGKIYADEVVLICRLYRGGNSRFPYSPIAISLSKEANIVKIFDTRYHDLPTYNQVDIESTTLDYHQFMSVKKSYSTSFIKIVYSLNRKNLRLYIRESGKQFYPSTDYNTEWLDHSGGNDRDLRCEKANYSFKEAMRLAKNSLDDGKESVRKKEEKARLERQLKREESERQNIL